MKNIQKNMTRATVVCVKNTGLFFFMEGLLIKFNSNNICFFYPPSTIPFVFVFVFKLIFFLLIFCYTSITCRITSLISIFQPSILFYNLYLLLPLYLAIECVVARRIPLAMLYFPMLNIKACLKSVSQKFVLESWLKNDSGYIPECFLRCSGVRSFREELKKKDLVRGVFTKKICDTGLGNVGGQKGIKTRNCKKCLMSFNY
jgi:hypothetical protein